MATECYLDNACSRRDEVPVAPRRGTPRNLLFSCPPPELVNLVIIPQLQALRLDPPTPQPAADHDKNNNTDKMNGDLNIYPSVYNEFVNKPDIFPTLSADVSAKPLTGGSFVLRHDAKPFSPAHNLNKSEERSNYSTCQVSNAYSACGVALCPNLVEMPIAPPNFINPLDVPLAPKRVRKKHYDNIPSLFVPDDQSANMSRCQYSIPDFSKLEPSLSGNADEKLVSWPSLPMVLNNPFYDCSNTPLNPNGQIVCQENCLVSDDVFVPPYSFVPVDPQATTMESTIPLQYYYGSATLVDADPWSPIVETVAQPEAAQMLPNDCTDPAFTDLQTIPYVPLENFSDCLYSDYAANVEDTPYMNAGKGSPFVLDYYDPSTEAEPCSSANSLSPYLEDEKSQISAAAIDDASYVTPLNSEDSCSSSPTKELQGLIDFTKDETSVESSSSRREVSAEPPSSYSVDCDQSSLHVPTFSINDDLGRGSLEPIKPSEFLQHIPVNLGEEYGVPGSDAVEEVAQEAKEDLLLRGATVEGTGTDPQGKRWSWLRCPGARSPEGTAHQIRVLDPDGNTVGLEECTPVGPTPGPTPPASTASDEDSAQDEEVWLYHACV